METWKAIPGFERYQISSLGRVKNTKIGSIRGLSHPSARTEYLKTSFRNENGDIKTFDVHRLVAEAFCPKPNESNKLEVDHLNRNTLDNRASNLEWVTPDENRRRSRTRTLDYSVNDTSVVWYKENGEILGVFENCLQAHFHTGMSLSGITKCCSKKYPRAHSFKGNGFMRVPTIDAEKLLDEQMEDRMNALEW